MEKRKEWKKMEKKENGTILLFKVISKAFVYKLRG